MGRERVARIEEVGLEGVELSLGGGGTGSRAYSHKGISSEKKGLPKGLRKC